MAFYKNLSWSLLSGHAPQTRVRVTLLPLAPVVSKYDAAFPAREPPQFYRVLLDDKRWELILSFLE